METFQQLLELDDDDGDFSREMVWAFFTQAESTFQSMDAALYVQIDHFCVAIRFHLGLFTGRRRI